MEASPFDLRRTRTGALLGAIAGPPLLILGAYPLLAPRVAASGKEGTFPWWIVAIFVSWAVAVVGMPLIGACIAAGGWIGRMPGRRLANHCIGGGFAGGVLAALLLRVAPALAVESGGAVLRLVVAEAGLLVGVVLCFRKGMAPPPA